MVQFLGPLQGVWERVEYHSCKQEAGRAVTFSESLGGIKGRAVKYPTTLLHDDTTQKTMICSKMLQILLVGNYLHISLHINRLAEKIFNSTQLPLL